MIDALTINSDSILLVVGHCVWVGAVVAATARGLLQNKSQCATDKERMIAIAFWIAVALPFVALIPADGEAESGVSLGLTPNEPNAAVAQAPSGATVLEPEQAGGIVGSALPWFGAAWVCGSLVLMRRLIRSARLAARLRKETRRHHWSAAVLAEFRQRGIEAPQAWTSPSVEGAMVLGVRSPRIVMGQALLRNLPPSTQADIAAHELAHLHRNDPTTDLIQRIAIALFWVFPAIYWLVLKSRQYRELACDEWVVSRGRCRFGYARSLLRVRARVSGFATPDALALGATGDGLALRVRSLTGSEEDRRPGTRRTTALRALPLAMPLLAAALLFPSLLVIADQLPTVEYLPSNRGQTLDLTEREWASIEAMLQRHAPLQWRSVRVDREASGYSPSHRSRFDIWTTGVEGDNRTDFITVNCGFQPATSQRRIACDLPRFAARARTGDQGGLELRGDLHDPMVHRLRSQIAADLAKHATRVPDRQMSDPPKSDLIIYEQSRLRDGQRVAIDPAIIADVSFHSATVRLVYHPSAADRGALELYSIRCHQSAMFDLDCGAADAALEQRGRGSPFVADRIAASDYESLLSAAGAAAGWPGAISPDVHTTREDDRLFATLEYAFSATGSRTARQSVACAKATSELHWQCEKAQRNEELTIDGQPGPVSLVGGETFGDASVVRMIREAQEFVRRYPDIDRAATPVNVFAVILRCQMINGARHCQDGSRVILDIAGTAVTLQFDPNALSREEFRLSAVVSRQDGFSQCRGHEQTATHSA